MHAIAGVDQSANQRESNSLKALGITQVISKLIMARNNTRKNVSHVIVKPFSTQSQTYSAKLNARDRRSLQE